MPYDLKGKFVVAVSSRALLDLAEADTIFRTRGSVEHDAFQRSREDAPCDPGPAFALARSLLALNAFTSNAIEVVIVSRNSPAAAIRIRRSLEHHGLSISRSWYTSGDPIAPYLSSAEVDLYLSANPRDVEAAHANGFASAHVKGLPKLPFALPDDELRIAFDGDAVLFGEESEAIYKTGGIEAFMKNESALATIPLSDGPMARVFRGLALLKRRLPKDRQTAIKLALVTARNSPADERVLRTFRHWKVFPDHLAFLGGADKSSTLRAFQPHIFFDDQEVHCTRSARFIFTAQVPSSLSSISDDPPQCPKCQQAMTLRFASKGPRRGTTFWGCIDFPRCNGNLSIA